MNDLIYCIKSKIEEDKNYESSIIAEMANIMPRIEKAHYIDRPMICLLERQYNDKIGKIQTEIKDMESHIKELTANA